MAGVAPGVGDGAAVARAGVARVGAGGVAAVAAADGAGAVVAAVDAGVDAPPLHAAVTAHSASRQDTGRTLAMAIV